MSLPALRSLRPRLSCSASATPLLTRSYAQRSWDDSDQGSSYSSSPRRPSTGSAAPRNPLRPRMPRNPPPGPPPSEEELARRAAKRVQRAERLERKDLTAQLTPTKTYMGGFTQPRHLAFLNTLDPTRKEKDSYAVRVGADRVRPSDEAYEPHIVYLAVTRYPIRWGHGRATRRETFSGFCKLSEMEETFRQLNYGKWREARVDMKQLMKGRQKEPVQVEAGWICPSESQEYCDLAVWPGSPQERSLLNKPIYSARKERDRLKAAATNDPEALAELADLPPLPDLLPPVPDTWTPPPAPYLYPYSPRLIIPLLTVTLPTRPLAATLARLCNSHTRGLSFVASVPNSDRKDGPPFFRRLLRMRADRIRELTGEIIAKLQGVGGGFFGLRLKSEDKGRGVEGEMLGEDIETPVEGWGEVRFLEAESDVWEGIEQQGFRDSWKDLEGVREGEAWTEEARVQSEVDQGRREDQKWVEECEAQLEEEKRPKRVPLVEAVQPSEEPKV